MSISATDKGVKHILYNIKLVIMACADLLDYNVHKHKTDTYVIVYTCKFIKFQLYIYNI